MGCTVLPEMTLAGAPSGVVWHRLDDLNLSLPLMLVWRRDANLPTVRRLIDLAESQDLMM